MIRHQIVGDRGLRDTRIEADQEYNLVVTADCNRCHEPVTIILEVLDNDHRFDPSSSGDADGRRRDRSSESTQEADHLIALNERRARGNR